MTTTKAVPFSAPFSSETFNNAQNIIAQTNGVLVGGAVSQDGLVITVQPLTFLQNGQSVDCSNALTLTLGTALTGPCFIGVSSSTPMQNLGEIITPTIISRPQDLTSTIALIAEWDGQEWRQLPYVSIGQMQADIKNRIAHNAALVGVTSGFVPAIVSDDIVVSPGSAYMTDGSYVQKASPVSLPILPSDPSGFDRIDSIVLRKPVDTPARTATVEYIVGGVYSDSGNPVLGTPVAVDSTGSTGFQVTLNDPSTDDLYFLFVDGLSGSPLSGTLNFKSSTNVLGSLSAATQIGSDTTVTSVSAVINSNGNIDVVYTVGSNVKYTCITTTGTVVYAASIIYAGAAAVSNVKITSVASGSDYFLHVIVQQFVSVSQNNIGYIRLTSANVVATPYQTLINLSASLTGATLGKVERDSLLYVALSNASTGAILLYAFDGSTSTQSAGPTAVGTPLTVSGNTYDLSAATLLPAPTPTASASLPGLKIQDKEVFVFWLQQRSGGTNVSPNKIMSIYNENYLEDFGFTAIAQDLFVSGEEITSYFVDADGLCNAHFILIENGATQVAAANVNLKTLAVTAPVSIATGSTYTYVRTIFTSLGALIHSYATSAVVTAVKSTASITQSLFSTVLPASDISIANYRTSDQALAITTPALDEATNQDRSLSLISGGTWKFVVSTGVLSWSAGANISIPGLADSANAIAAGSVTLANGQVAYCTLNRSGAGGTVAVAVEAVASYVQPDNAVIFARRIGSVCRVGVGGGLITLLDGEARTLGQGGYLTTQSITAGVALTQGQVCYVSGTSALLLDATNPAKLNFGGMVAANVAMGGTALLVTDGIVTWLTGLTPGALYYADPATPGGITVTKPASSTQTVPIGQALTATTLQINSALAATAAISGSGSGLTYPSFFVLSESNLATAITGCTTAGGGVICLAASFSISTPYTIPPGTVLIGRKGATVVTALSGAQFVLSDGVKMVDVWLTTTELSFTMLALENNYATVRDCQFTIPPTSIGSCILVTGDSNKMYNNIFIGVAGETAMGINYLSGVGNADHDSVFLA